MSRHENIRKAKEIIASRRAESIASYEGKNAEVSALFPAFRELTAQLNMTGAKIMASALGKGDGALTLDQIHAEYDLLVEKKRALLRENGYPEDYCDIQFHCPHCADTGYVGINVCQCLRKEMILSSLENSGLYHLVKEQNFDTFDLSYYNGDDKAFMTRNVAILKRFVEQFGTEGAESFLFLGPTGLGKTHLSSAVAYALIEKGAYVVYETALKLFGDYELRRFGSSGYSNDDVDDIDRYMDADLLIIDDLGCEMTNQFTVSCLYNIVNARMMRRKSTIISTNLTQAELRKRYSDRIASRLFSEYKPLPFRGYDIREQKLRKSFE